MVKSEDLKVGLVLVFTGYAQEVPEGNLALAAGTKVTYVSHVPDGDGMDITVEAENPNFNAKQRPSAKNPAKVQVHVWENEVELDAPKVAAKSRTKAAPAAAAGKSAAATKPATAGKPATRTKAAATEVPATKATVRRGAKDAPATDEKAEAKAKLAAEKAAKAAAKEAAKNEPEVYVPDVDVLKGEDAEVLAIVNGSKDVDELVGIAIDTITESMNSDYTLGGIIYHLRLSGAFVNYGGDGKYSKANGGFKAFCEKELDFSYRKATYFSNIYFQFNKLGIASDKVQQIGWTKAMKIAEAASMGDSADENAKPISKADAAKLITMAKKATVEELDEHIKTQYRHAATPSEKFKKIPFSLPDARASIILNHIETAKEMYETESRDEAIARIIEAWADDNVGEA